MARHSDSALRWAASLWPDSNKRRYALVELRLAGVSPMDISAASGTSRQVICQQTRVAIDSLRYRLDRCTLEQMATEVVDSVFDLGQRGHTVEEICVAVDMLFDGSDE